MKKMTFKVSSKNDGSVVSLIKEVNKISCRIQIDLENGFIAVENVDDAMIDSVIELIDQYYTISNVNINNTSDDDVSVEPSQSVVDESEPKVDAESAIKPENNPTVVAPQSEDDLIIQRVEFSNKYIEALINKLIRTIYWAMYKMNISEKEIGEFIWTSIHEISMRYNNKGCIKYSVGDIVECNYGMHLVGEINGGHVGAIVCSITTSGMAYLVPITKVRKNLTSLSYLTIDVPQDATYNNEYYVGGTALLDKGKYLRAERFNAVIGKVTPEFLAKVLNQLSTTFNFTGNTVVDESADDNGNDLEAAGKTETTITDDTSDVTSESVTTKVNDEETKSELTDDSEVSITNSQNPAKKASNIESALLDIIGDSLEKLDRTKKVEEQVEAFLTEIGMTTTERMVTQSFVIACDIKKINYENVILELHNMFPRVREDIIKSVLKENFKKWLELHPELVEICPTVSLMAVLKVFAKKFE